MRGAFLSLRWQIIRHGPNDDRGFGLIAGLVAATAVVYLSVLARAGMLHPSWLTVAVSVFGLTWLLGPILLPGYSPTLRPEWFGTLPHRSKAIARAMSASEPIGVGAVITAVAVGSFVVFAAGDSWPAIGVAVVAAGSQLFFLLWLGRCASALVSRMLRSNVGLWLAAFQMSALLALSFAGWVPLSSVMIPRLGEGITEIVALDGLGAVPPAVESRLLFLPTGWGLAAVYATSSHASVYVAVALIAGLVASGIILREIWIALTALTLRQPPSRMHSNVTARVTSSLNSRPNGPAWAATVRELKTWFRDPHRKLGLVHAWITPLLMILLVAPTNWYWALPLIGVMAAILGAMVAVNTYALDGTAIWQLITTPRAISADVRGRQQAWMLLFGIPILVGTTLLCLISQSPLWALALGMTIAAIGSACALAPLLSALMPAIGADARDRVSSTHGAGNSAGGQWTVFAAVAIVAIAPAVIAQVSGLGWHVHIILGAAFGAATLLALTPVTERYLHRTGPALLSAMASGSHTPLRSRPGERN